MNKFLAIILFFVLTLVLGGCTSTNRPPAERWGTLDTGASVSTSFRVETGRDHTREFRAEKRKQLGTHVYRETHYSRPFGNDGPVVKSTISRGEEVRYNYGKPLPVTNVKGREGYPVLGGLRDLFKGLGTDVEYSRESDW